jgi:predicted DNA-binding transcriptional regulator AlpA
MQSTPQADDALIDTRQAAAVLGISPTTLEIWRSTRVRDQPAFVRVGRRVRYERQALAAWIDSRRENPSKSQKDRSPGRQRRRPGPR